MLCVLASPAHAQFGAIVGWGDRSVGQTTPLTQYPFNIVQIAAGDNYSLVRGTDGSVAGWGANYSGQTQPPLLSNAAAIVAGSSHGLALLTDTTVIGWGNNFDGQASPPPGLINVDQIAAGDDFSLALTASGVVTGWGNNFNGAVTPPVFTAVVTAIAAGKDHSLALLNNGTVVGWGDNSNGEANPPSFITNVAKIAGGRNFSLVLKTDNTVDGWGDNFYGQLNAPPSLTNAAEIAAGAAHGVALRTDGTVVCWGDNTYGQTNVPPGLSNVVEIAAGENHTLVRRNDGSLVGWGDNSAGQARAPHVVGRDAMAIDAGGKFALAVKPDGNLVGWGADDFGQASPPPNSTNLVSFSAGYDHGLAVDSNRNDFGWGNSTNGKSIPAVFLTNVVRVSAGRDHSLFLNSNGTLFAQGDDSFQQVTDTPFSLSNVTAIAAGAWFNVALLSDMTVTGWGQNFAGQCNPPAGLANVVAVDAGQRHVVALKSDGTVTSWGDNAYGQLNQPVGLTGVIAVAAGGQHSLALLSSRKVLAWGDGGFGQTNVPVGLSNVFAIAAGDAFSLALSAYPAEISVQPAGTNVNTGGGIALNVGVLGSTPFTFQWRKDGTNIPGATAQNYIVGSAGAADVGNYDVIVSNLINSVTSQVASVTVSGGGNPPFIVTQPASLSLYSGSVATFTSGATGDPPIFFQWSQNGTNRPGATATNFQIASIVPADAGTYRMVASNAFGMVTSFAATLLVDDPAHITAHPTNITVNPGAAAQFEVTAAGAGPLMFQWRKEGTNLLGQTSPFLSFTGVTLGDAGNYDVIVSNNLASVTSGIGVLTVQSSPAIVAGPTNTTTVAGNPFGFNVSAVGSAPLYYQWRQGGSPIAGATNAGYGQASATPADAGSYDVVITNAFGGITSATATLTVLVPPVVTDPPDPLSVTAGSAASFAVAATGTAPIVYQWRHNGTPIGGATTTNFSIGSTVPGDAGPYDVLVSNVAGIVTSAAATLTVNVGPVFTVNPTNTTVNVGSNVTFNAAATGTLPLVYQWRKDGSPLPGATAASFTITNTVPGSAGNYDVLASNIVGAITSAQATLLIIVPPTIVSNPANHTVAAGVGVTFGVAATGTIPFAYQWRKDGTNIAGSVSATHVIGSTVPADAGIYVVLVSNAIAVVTSTPATLIVQGPPVILAGPTNLTVPAGAAANFSVTATGAAPVVYQWRHNGTTIPGATGTNYMIAAATAADTGTYAVVVSNIAGSVTSAAANLFILDIPVITAQPTNIVATLGTPAALSVTVTSGLPLFYQWRQGVTDIANANSSTFNFPSVSPGDIGIYRVIVSNTAGSVTSAPASLSVLAGIAIFREPRDLAVWRNLNALFDVVITGAPPISYQWYYNGANLAGATNPALALPTADYPVTGAYHVVAANTFGAVTSRAARLSVRSRTAPGTRNDFDGDGLTDIGVFVPVTGNWQVVVWRNGRFITLTPRRPPQLIRGWRILESAAGYNTVDFGWMSDTAATGDFDGDGSTDPCVFRPSSGMWYLLPSSTGLSTNQSWGWDAVKPVPGDYDGDDLSDIAVYNPTTGDWFIRQSSDGLLFHINWGWSGATPVQADYDGDNITDPAVYDAKTGDWFVLPSSSFQGSQVNWGGGIGIVPVEGDYDGDGLTDPAVYQPASGTWFILRSSDGQPMQRQWGWSGLRPVPGDYDGDTITDFAGYDQATGTWYVRQSTDGLMLGGGPIPFGYGAAPPMLP